MQSVHDMTDSQMLLEISKAVAQQLWNALKDDPQTNTIINNQGLITFSSPKIAVTGSEKLSIFLYSIQPDQAYKDAPPLVATGHGQAKQAVYIARYLITPVTGNAEHDVVLIDKITQTLTKNPIMEIFAGETSKNTVKIMQDTLSLTDLTQLWTALGEPLRVCASFIVTFGEAASTPPTQPTPTSVLSNPRVMELYRTVFETFEQQVNDWKNRNLFQKQYVQSDFSKTTGLTVDQMRSEIRDLGEKLETNRPIKPHMESLIKLQEFYEHQQAMLKGFEKVQKKRQEGIDMVAKWKNEVTALIEALKTQQ